MPTLGKTIFELERIFRVLNNRYYDGKLERPIIAVQAKGNTNSLGWCTSKQIWKKVDTEDVVYYEITFTAEHLTRTNEAIVETMLHEMVHLYAGQNKIKDVSRGGTYHNERYKQLAESHGLSVECVEKYGWILTSLNDEAREYVPEIKVNRQAFNISRIDQKKTSKGKTKQSSRKYECPVCGLVIRATKDLTDKLMCVDCNEILIEN